MIMQTLPERELPGPDCDARCRLTRAIRPGLLGLVMLEQHSPQAHYEAGRRAAEDALGRSSAVVRTGPLAIMVDDWEVELEGREVVLPEIERRLLMALARRAGRAVPCDSLIADVWGVAHLDTGRRAAFHALDGALCRLRRQLRPWGGLIIRVGVGRLRLDLLGPGARPRPVPNGIPPERWARDWEACRRCGGTDRLHNGRGYCTACHKYLIDRGELA